MKGITEGKTGPIGQVKVLCCGFEVGSWRPKATEFISKETASSRNRMALAWPDGPFAAIWIPIRSVADVFAKYPELDKLTHISNGPGKRRGIACSHRSMPHTWDHGF